MPSKRLNVPPSGARPSTKEPPLSIAGVNPVRVPPSAAAVAIAAVNYLPDFHPPQSSPLRAPLRSALANQQTRCGLRSAPPLRIKRPLRASSRPLHALQRWGIIVVAARSGSPRSPPLARSGRSSIESSRPVRARKFPRLCRLSSALRPQSCCRCHVPRS